jgi:hypothetical protein
LKIGIKYCGGCNPKFNRSAFVAGLAVKYKEKVKIEPIKEDIIYDIVIILNGCSSVCVNISEMKHKGKILSVASEKILPLYMKK